jgi:hypothetical protein
MQDRRRLPAKTKSRLALGVALTELVDSTARVNHLLLTRVEGMAAGADFQIQVTSSRPGLKSVAAAARYSDFFVFRMDSGFHGG